jgi:hypothetical protein
MIDTGLLEASAWDGMVCPAAVFAEYEYEYEQGRCLGPMLSNFRK